MSNWLSKSNESFSIANNEESLMFNNRVHCYYYGCVQHLFHILHTKLKMDIKAIADNCNPKINPGNGGGHIWLKNYIFKDLRDKTYHIDGLDLNNHLGALKRLRSEADYGYESIDSRSLATARDLSRKIENILIKRYNNE